MKHLLTTSLLVLAFFTAVVSAAPTTVHAQAACQYACESQAACGQAGGQAVGGTCAAGANGQVTDICCQNPGDTTQAQSNAAASAANTAAAQQSANQTPTQGALGNAYDAVMTQIMGLFAWLVGAAMITLNYAMYFTVVAMGSYISQLTAVGVTWRVLRDIGNIVLIFGFIAVGITIILNVNWYGGGKKMLPMLLIAAVFLNFSLFLAEAVVDVGNLFATEFYTQINGGNLPTAAGLANSRGIADTIMAQLGLQTIYNPTTNTATQVLKSGTAWYIGWMAVILFIVLAFVLFSLAFILISRFVILLFLIIIAPIGFAGLIIPKLDNTAKLWWSTLFEQTITAPVLLLLLYIALTVITDANFLTGFGTSTQLEGASWLGTQVNGGLTGFGPVLLSFLVAMALLLAVVMVSKRMSAFGGTWATKTAGALTFGATGWALNRTVGRGAYYAKRGLKQNKTLNRIDAATGRVTSRLLNRGATGSFDLRGTGALKVAKVDAGTAAKDGFTGARTRSIKEHEEAAKAIETAFKDKGSERFKPIVMSERTTAIEKAQKEQVEAAAASAAAAAQVVRLKAYAESNSEPEAQIALDKAERDLVETQRKATIAADNFAAANKKMEEAQKDIDKAAGARMNEEIKANKRKYAEGITDGGVFNPINLIAYGPSSGAAARKIRESLKDKSADQKLIDMVKQVATEGEETPAAGATPPAAAPAGETAHAAAPTGG